MPDFKDHFSRQSVDYKRFRPSYPPELYSYLSDICGGRVLAWDCATGTGQAAQGLSPFFDHIVATDASEKQISQAQGADNISFRIATAEKTELETSSVDLIVVAQALHWFDHDAFYQEVKRVLKPGGILAVWTYDLLEINEKIDPIIHKLNDDIVGEYWPSERQLVRDKYQTIDFPFQEKAAPSFSMASSWTRDDLIGYLGTWSSVVRYRADKGRDPLQEIMPALSAAWGQHSDKKTIQWPLSFRIGCC